MERYGMMIVKGLLGGLLQVLIFALLLLLPAALLPGGTWYWIPGMLFIAGYGILIELSILLLGLMAPASLEARLRRPREQRPKSDKIVSAVLLFSVLLWALCIPFDVFYFRLLPAPSPMVSLLGGLLCLAGYGVVIISIYQNAFAVPYVEMQKARGQVLVDTGLYAVIRHPLYAGVMCFVLGLALWLESYAAAIASVLLLAILIARIAVEEHTLAAQLPGYSAYMKTHPYRLIPFIW